MTGAVRVLLPGWGALMASAAKEYTAADGVILL